MRSQVLPFARSSTTKPGRPGGSVAEKAPFRVAAELIVATLRSTPHSTHPPSIAAITTRSAGTRTARLMPARLASRAPFATTQTEHARGDIATRPAEDEPYTPRSRATPPNHETPQSWWEHRAVTPSLAGKVVLITGGTSGI